MTCSDAQRVLPEIMEGGENVDFQAHLKSCPTCQELMTELELIAAEAHQLAQSEEPPQRLWVKIAAELRSEGLIREPEEAAKPVLAPRSRSWWHLWWLAPVAAGLVLTVSYLLSDRPAAPVANQTQPATMSAEPAVTATTEKPATDNPAEVSPKKSTNKQVATQAEPGNVDQGSEPANVPTTLASDGQFLSGFSRQPPAVRATFENQLRAVNAYIRDAEAYVRQYPDDEDAKQQLMYAYEQKSMLYQMALDHVQ